MASEVRDDPAGIDELLQENKPSPSFAVGLNVYLTLHRDGDDLRLCTTCRGWVEGEFFLVDAPVEGGGEISSRKHEPVTVRYLLDGVVYGFNCVFIRKLSDPGSLWCLGYPDLMERRQVRKHRRYTPFTPVDIEGVEGPARIADMSDGGAFVEVPPDQAPEPGTRWSLSFMLPTGARIEGVEAEIMNVATDGVGVSFVDAESEQVREIESFLAAMAEEPADGPEAANG